MEMKKISTRRSNSGFTLIEMLTVIVILGILMAMTVGITKGVMETSRKAKATGEISSFGLALERFETDNGFLPPSTYITRSGDEYAGNAKSETYREASAVLFLALTGRQVYQLDQVDPTVKDNLGKNYLSELKANQVFTDGTSHNIGAKSWILDSYTSAGTISISQGAMKDPWGFPYGYYYNADPSTPGENSIHNGSGYDLWTTAGNTKEGPKIILKWVSNWQN